MLTSTSVWGRRRADHTYDEERRQHEAEHFHVDLIASQNHSRYGGIRQTVSSVIGRVDHHAS